MSNDLARRTIGADLTDDEYAVYEHRCKSLGIDPLSKMIIPRVFVARDGKRNLSLIATIDCMRALADATGNYIPGGSVEWVAKDGDVGAIAHVRRLVGGNWHDCYSPCAAMLNEYYPPDENGRRQGYADYMPTAAIAKCAEASALRRAFPAILSGLYVSEEMQRVESVSQYDAPPPLPKKQQADDRTQKTQPQTQNAESQQKRIPKKGDVITRYGCKILSINERTSQKTSSVYWSTEVDHQGEIVRLFTRKVELAETLTGYFDRGEICNMKINVTDMHIGDELLAIENLLPNKKVLPLPDDENTDILTAAAEQFEAEQHGVEPQQPYTLTMHKRLVAVKKSAKSEWTQIVTDSGIYRTKDADVIANAIELKNSAVEVGWTEPEKGMLRVAVRIETPADIDNEWIEV